VEGLEFPQSCFCHLGDNFKLNTPTFFVSYLIIQY